MKKRLTSKIQNYKDISFILIFFFFRKILIFPPFLQLKLNIVFKFIIIFIDNEKNKLNLNFKENNNMNNVFSKC